MQTALTIIFAFMIFMLIIKKCNFLFIGVFSILLIAAISLGVGYGIATFVMSIIGSVFKVLLFVGIALAALVLVLGSSSR